MFIDVEASALTGGYPIEVGWAAPQARDSMTSGAVVISPAGTDWTETCAWDPMAQVLHGLTPEMLLLEGLSPQYAAFTLNSALSEQIVYSDNPPKDGTWIELLFEKACCSPTFSFAPKSASSLIVELADQKRMGDLDYTEADQEARRRAGRRHRAEPDALYWAHLWSLIISGYRAPEGTPPRFGPLRREP